ncbi:MAG: hypothetical protein JWP03_3301 [Phycisphaerales bacterium]|jgi:hypothetical protein|nr:hypothetical protein [Phycisphaerales bacterium]
MQTAFANRGVAGAILILLAMGLATRSVAAQRAAAGETFHSTTYGYSVTLPAGWYRVPDSQLQRGIAVLHSQSTATQNLQWEAAYQANAGEPFTTPYVILQVMPYPNGRQPTEAQMEDAVKQLTGNNYQKYLGQSGNTALRQALSNASVGTAQYDPATRTVYQTMGITGKSGRIKAVIVGHFGKDAMVGVMSYEGEANFADRQADFDQLNASFKFDPATDYDSSLNPNIKLIGAAAIGVLAVVGMIVIVVVSRRPRQPMIR